MDEKPVRGTMYLRAATPNPLAAAENQLYLFSGDPTSGLIDNVFPEVGLTIPQPLQFSPSREFLLSIFHINDLHGQLVRISQNSEESVVSRMAWLLQSTREQFKEDPHKAVLTVSAGDDGIGSIFDELMGTEPQNYQVHASYQVLSALGLDIAVLGNHDFDRGLPLLAYSIQQEARFPILAANLSGCQELDGLVFSAAVLVTKGIRIGIIGLVTRAEINLFDSCCKVAEPLQTLHNLLPAVRPFCDVLILLSHLGHSLNTESAQTLDAGDIEIAESLSHGEIDLIIGGHSHDALNPHGLNPENVVNGIPIVQAGAFGRYVGQVDITLSGKRPAITKATLIATESLPSDLTFDHQIVQPLVTKVRSLLTRKIGRVENDPQLNTDTVLNCFAARELALANFITDAMIERLDKAGIHADIAMIDSSTLKQGLETGSLLTWGQWFDIMPFSDKILLYQLTGAQLYELLQDNARRVDILCEQHTERGFMQFSQQVRYKIVRDQERSNLRAETITVNGIPLDEQLEVTFFIVAPCFVRKLASNWEIEEHRHTGHPFIDLVSFPKNETGKYLRTEMVTYIEKQGGVTHTSGARCDGRLEIQMNDEPTVTSLSVREFIKSVSDQDHAMAGTVIALSAAQAAALALACLRISQFRMKTNKEELANPINTLEQVKDQLLLWGNRDANAIADFVKLREAGQELTGKTYLCQIPVNISRLCLCASDILKEARPLIQDQVKDDLEISIHLLVSSAQAAIMLLESNLRIWPEKSLWTMFEPVLQDLTKILQNNKLRRRIRE